MSELDPEIWKNKTLGAASTNPFLDEVEAQKKEDRVARIEQREPMIAVHHPRFPQMPPSGSVPSKVTQIEFIEPGEVIPDEPGSGIEEPNSTSPDDNNEEDDLFTMEDFEDDRK
ncbi:hypothetical protein [Streptomyces hebeiensis]